MRFQHACVKRHIGLVFVAGCLQHILEEPQGSWRICEKDSDAIVSRHPGDRSWNDLLG
jgi:hypothetical protein